VKNLESPTSVGFFVSVCFCRFGNMKHILSFIVIAHLLYSCTNEVEDNYSTPIETVSNDLIFKKWTQDTLSILKNDSSLNKIIDVSEDTLSLKIITHYKAWITKSNTNSLSEKIKNIYAFLSEYDEIPDKDFQLNFSSYYFYYPSTNHLKYDYVFELKNIEILTDKNKTKYDYIRGNLSRKEVINLDNNNVESYNFIWNNDSLVKVKL
jgi:hypothetical protein